MNIGNLHLFIDRLAHVVNSEQRDGHADQGFHFYSGLCDGLCSTFHFCSFVRRNNVDFNIPERERVTEWNQLRSLFCSLNTGDPRSREDVPLCDLILCDQFKCCSLELNLSTRNRPSLTHRLCRYIDHLRPAVTANVSESLHLLAADGNHPAIWLVVIPKVVLLRLSIDNVQEELFQLSVAGTGPQRFHNIELQIAAEAWTQFAVARETKLVAALTEMQVGHCPDKADPLLPSGDQVIRSRAVCAK